MLTQKNKARHIEAIETERANYAQQVLRAPLGQPSTDAAHAAHTLALDQLEAERTAQGRGINLMFDTFRSDALAEVVEQVDKETQPLLAALDAAFQGGPPSMSMETRAELDAAEMELHDTHIVEARSEMSQGELQTHLDKLRAQGTDVSLDSFRSSKELEQCGRPFEGPIAALLDSSRPRPALASASKQSKSHRASLIAILFAMLAQFAMSGAVAAVVAVLAEITHTHVFGAAITVGMCVWPRSWFYVIEFPDPVILLRHTPPNPALLAFLDSSIVFWSAGVREKRRTFRLMQTTLALPSGGRIRFPIGKLSPAQEDTMCIAILMVLRAIPEPAVVAKYGTTGSREAAAKAAIAVLATVQPMFDYWNPFPF